MSETSERPVPGVSASLTFVAYDLRPEELTTCLGIEPSHTDATPLPASFHGNTIKASRDCGLWSYDTAGKLAAIDPAEHIRHLVRLFRPLKSRIEEFTPPLRAFVQVRCGPVLTVTPGPVRLPRFDADCVAGLADLGAALTIELITAR